MVGIIFSSQEARTIPGKKQYILPIGWLYATYHLICKNLKQPLTQLSDKGLPGRVFFMFGAEDNGKNLKNTLKNGGILKAGVCLVLEVNRGCHVTCWFDEETTSSVWAFWTYEFSEVSSNSCRNHQTNCDSGRVELHGRSKIQKVSGKKVSKESKWRKKHHHRENAGTLGWYPSCLSPPRSPSDIPNRYPLYT